MVERTIDVLRKIGVGHSEVMGEKPAAEAAAQAAAEKAATDKVNAEKAASAQAATDKAAAEKKAAEDAAAAGKQKEPAKEPGKNLEAAKVRIAARKAQERAEQVEAENADLKVRLAAAEAAAKAAPAKHPDPAFDLTNLTTEQQRWIKEVGTPWMQAELERQIAPLRDELGRFKPHVEKAAKTNATQASLDAIREGVLDCADDLAEEGTEVDGEAVFQYIVERAKKGVILGSTPERMFENALEEMRANPRKPAETDEERSKREADNRRAKAAAGGMGSEVERQPPAGDTMAEDEKTIREAQKRGDRNPAREVLRRIVRHSEYSDLSGKSTT